MPSSIHTGLPWSLCPSDAHSALLIELFPSGTTESHQHHMHADHQPYTDHSEHTSHSADKSCEFSALGYVIAQGVPSLLPDFITGSLPARLWSPLAVVKTAVYQRPPARAPPV